MGAIVSTLGPDRVCCLTGVRENATAPNDGFAPRIYRRPVAFAKSRYVQAVGWCATLAEIMIRENPQVVQLATAYDGYLGLWIRRWLKVPYVIYAHGNEILAILQGISWPQPRLALQQADCVLANSQFTANLVQKVGVTRERIAIVHPGCEINRFHPLPHRKDLRQKILGPRHSHRVILTVGNLVARKGHDMVIQALPIVCQSVPDITYLIIGEGPYRTQLETLAKQLGVWDRVILAGRVPEEELPDVYALCDVFVMPSREEFEACDVEGFGMVFLEANACGKPVIGGQSGGIPEAVVHGVTGLLVNPRDPVEIAHALTRLLSDAALARRLGEQGQLRVSRDFTWARVAAQVQGILESILREKSAHLSS